MSAKEAPMRARLLVLHRKEMYPGENGPEIMAVADEYTLDQNSEWWESEVAGRRAWWPTMRRPGPRWTSRSAPTR